MKCQNCGNEIEEGHLICEVCGNEIQIVPDFEPELENSITEALSTLAALQEEEAKEEQTTAKEPEPAAAKGHVRKEIEPVEADDEYDEEEEELLKEIGMGTYDIAGSMKLSDINDALFTTFESDDYDSIGGIMIENLARIPKKGESVTFSPLFSNILFEYYICIDNFFN